MPDQKLYRPIKLSGRALYDDGQMINSNVINPVSKELGLNSFSKNMAAAGELRCLDSSLF